MKCKNVLLLILVALAIAAAAFYFITNTREVQGQVSTQISANTKIIAFGDSLVAGVGATSGNDFVSVLSRRIGAPIINSGISGDTTADALARVDRDVVNQNPSIVIVFLGGNDIIQRLPMDQQFSNLRTIIQRIQNGGAKVIVVGIHNDIFGVDYEAGYRNVASETGAAYVPNALPGILGNSQLSSDAVHPNDQGYQIVSDRVFPVLQNTINSLPNQELSVTCSVNDTTIATNQSVTWSASATGGAGNYRYEWSGSEGLSGTNASISKSYTSEGGKTASVRVISGNVQVNQTCSQTIVVKDPVLIGRCTIEVIGNQNNTNEHLIRFDSSFNGGVNGTTITWTGTDGLVGNSNGVEKVYTTLGTKTGQVQARSGNQTLPLICSADLSLRASATTTESIGGRCTPNVNGKRITWNAAGYGAQGNYTFQWSGSDGLSGTSSSITTDYSSEGIKTANVFIRSGNETINLSCQAAITNDVDSNGNNNGGGGCFIATAAYGTELQPEVQALRNFRDETLLQNAIGEKFVETYYKVSPPIADYIRDKEVLKSVVRGALYPVVVGLDQLGY